MITMNDDKSIDHSSGTEPNAKLEVPCFKAHMSVELFWGFDF